MTRLLGATWFLVLVGAIHLYLGSDHLVALGTGTQPSTQAFAAVPLWWTHVWKGAGATLGAALCLGIVLGRWSKR